MAGQAETGSRSKAFSAVRWTGASAAIRAVSAFAQLAILARLLSPEQIGVAALAISIAQTALAIADFGISNALMHFQDVSRDEKSSLYWFNIGVACILTIGLFLLAPFIAEMYGHPGLFGLVAMVSLVFVINASGVQFRILAEKKLRFRSVAMIEIVAALVGVAAATTTAIYGAGEYAVAIGLLAQLTLTTVLNVTYLARDERPGLHFSFSEVRKFLVFGSHIVGVNLANTIAMQADILLSGRFFTATQVGFYAQPRDLTLRIALVINPIVTRIGLPLLATAQDDLNRVARMYSSILRMTSAVNFPIYGVMAVFAPEITHIILGAQWTASSELLRFLALWCLVRSIGNPVGSLLYAMGATRRALASSITVMVLAGISVGVGAQFGTSGIPLALAALYSALILPFWLLLVRPVCGIGLWQYHEPLIVAAAATFLASGAGWAAALPLENYLARLAVGSAVAGVAYLAASWVLNRPWIDSILELVGLRKRR